MIGDEIRNSVFRDTKSFYRQFPADVVARPLINFTKRHAGKEILDLGCATGNYCHRLAKLGYSVKGADVNAEYVATARERGVDAVLIEDAVPFPDRSFDTVLVFEVLEHLADPEPVIKEAKRLSRHNVLFTTPNSGGVERLQREGLLFEHFADLDHKNFFTEENFAKVTQETLPHSIEPELVINKIDFDKVFDGFVRVITSSQYGSMLSLFGGKKALEPLSEPFKKEMKVQVSDIVSNIDIAAILQKETDFNVFRSKIDTMVNTRLNELTPRRVKEIIEEMIRKHLGWLVVWGGIFGALIGFVSVAML
ncbi:MAG: hypothetical protein HW374_333 [Bacteroidetes bacterium]|nr:hypothetical protein [Bacteroidota bacterium]